MTKIQSNPAPTGHRPPPPPAPPPGPDPVRKRIIELEVKVQSLQHELAFARRLRETAERIALSPRTTQEGHDHG